MVPAPETRRDLPLVVGAVVVLAAVVLAIVAVAVGGRVATLAADSPEGVVQQYVRAILSGDRDGARALTDLPDDCELLDDRPLGLADIRVTLGAVTLDDDRAVVEVLIDRSSDEVPADPFRTPQRSSFELDGRTGDWRITRSPWPFPNCAARP